MIYKKRALHVFFILSGIAIAFFRHEPVIELLDLSGKEVLLEGSFISVPSETEKGTLKQLFNVQSAFNKNTHEKIDKLHSQEIVILSDREIPPASECKILVRFLSNAPKQNPGNLVTKDIYATLLESNQIKTKNSSLSSKIQILRYRLNKYISANFNEDSSAFISTITIGHRSYMNEELRNAFNKSGLAHLLSISGTHFGLFSVFIFGIFRLLINLFPYTLLQRITIFFTPSQAAALLCLPFMLFYLALSGGSIPAIRSFIMVNLFLMGLIIGRKGSWLNFLIFSALILTIWNPEVISDLSFQLSFIAVLFIGFTIKNGEYLTKKEKYSNDKKSYKLIQKLSTYFKNALLLTISASIGTAPLVAYHFHYISIISPVSNLLITPFIGFILIPLSILSALLFLTTGHYLFTPIVSTFSDICIYLIKFIASIPYADIKIPAFPPALIILFYAGFIFYFLLKRKKYALIIPFIPILIYISFSVFERKELTVTFLDVGQGDSSVIELPDGKTIIIDTGRTGRETASFLKYMGKEEVDALVISHIHSDHAGGLYYLLNRFKVKEIWDNGRIILPDSYRSDLSDFYTKLNKGIKHKSLERGDLIEGKGYRIYVLHPYPRFYTMYGNESIEADNDSLVLKIKGKNESFLFTGDIEKEAEENLVNLGIWLKSDVLKVPHHGSKASAHNDFTELVSPQIAVISVGHDNPFGHPHSETLDTLQGLRILRTDLDGAIKMKESSKEFEIKTYKDIQFKKTNSFREEMKNIKRLFDTW
ncbi:MAG: DNA internalization-related competence protein ComEC/Rec2 [Thermodesulfovibrionales bacterium]